MIRSFDPVLKKMISEKAMKSFFALMKATPPIATKLDDLPFSQEENKRMREQKEVKEILGFLSFMSLLLMLSITSVLFFLYQSKTVITPPIIFTSPAGPYELNAPDLQRPIMPSLTPNHSPEALKNWVNESIKAIYTFDFLNIATQMQQMRSVFDGENADVFETSFLQSELYKTVSENRLKVSVTTLGNPEVLNAFLFENVIYWDIGVLVFISFEGEIPTTPLRYKVNLRIKQIPTTIDPKGLSVVSIAAVPG